MVKEHWRKYLSDPTVLVCAVEKTFLASRLYLTREDRLHLKGPMTDVASSEECRIGLELRLVTRAGLGKSDSREKVNVVVLTRVMMASCSNSPD